jgi:N-acetylglucosamine-6-phosphate deacetylase
MDHMVRHFREVTDATLPDIIRMASLTPAERVGIASIAGSLDAGKRADILLLTKDLKVKKVFVRGKDTEELG